MQLAPGRTDQLSSNGMLVHSNNFFHLLHLLRELKPLKPTVWRSTLTHGNYFIPKPEVRCLWFYVLRVHMLISTLEPKCQKSRISIVLNVYIIKSILDALLKANDTHHRYWCVSYGQQLAQFPCQSLPHLQQRWGKETETYRETV